MAGIAVNDDGGGLTVDAANDGSLNVQIGDGTDTALVDGSGNLNVLDANSAAILADTANMDTNLNTIAGAVVGTEMQVDIVADGAGLATAANQPAVYVDDTSTHATGTSEGNLLMAAATPTDSAVEANDIGAVAMSTDRRLHTDAQIVGQDANLNVDVAANTIGLATSANQLPDGHNVTVDNAAGASAVNIQDGGNKITVDWNGTDPPIGAGTEAAALRVTVATDSTGVVSVDDNAGSLTVDQATASSLNAQVVGEIAHDGADSGNPVKVGGKAIAHGANPTAVAAADRTDLYANRHGIPFVIGGHMNIVTFEAAYTGAQTDAAIVTVGAGTKIVVTQIQATCDNANTVDVGLRVGFGATTTPTTTGVVLTHPGIAAGSGISRGDGSGILGVGADNEDLRITSEVPTSGSLRILVSYYTIES